MLVMWLGSYHTHLSLADTNKHFIFSLSSSLSFKLLLSNFTISPSKITIWEAAELCARAFP